MRAFVVTVIALFVTEEVLAAGPGGKGKEYCAPGCKTLIAGLDSRLTAFEQNKGWEMVFRTSKGDGGNLVSKWEASHPYNEDQNVTANDLTKNFYGVYKSSKVEQWNSLVIDQVKVALFDNNGEEKAFMIFDGRHTTKMTFFSEDNLLASSMKNMVGSSYNYFSIKGDDAMSRHFFASKAYGGCGGDVAFFVVVDDGNVACDWMTKEAKPYFIYCPTDGPCNMDSEAVIADTFAIFIKT